MTAATIDRQTAPGLAEEEDRRFGYLLRSLTAEEWRTTTELPGWDVHAIALHILGEAESYRITELVHQLVAGRKAAKGRALVDGINDVQVANRAHLEPDQILVRLDDAAPMFLRFRRRLPWPLRAIRVPNPPFGWLSIGRLNDVVYTRDRWMHRLDVHRAIGRPFTVDANHDRHIVADIVAEWAERPGRPYRLVLDGPAGGTFRHGSAGGRTSSTPSSSVASSLAERQAPASSRPVSRSSCSRSTSHEPRSAGRPSRCRPGR